MPHTEFNKELAESCVQAFWKAIGIGCELSDMQGNVIASGGFCCSGCEICSPTGISKEDCKKLHAFTARASEREGGKYMYECPLGFSCITAAVLTADGAGARLTAGPFLMEDRQDFVDYDLTTVMHLSPNVISGIEPLLEPVPSVDPQKVNAYSQLLVCSAAFLSGSGRGGEDYLSSLESGDVNAWAKENRIDPSKTVESVIEFLRQNYSSDVSLLDVAKHAGMSTSYLCRLFKKEKGTTINACLTQIRIDQSKKMLETDADISVIAELCGFSDQSYFTKVFRQTEGITPLKYRKNSQNS